MRTNYILIDYENVQPGSLSEIKGHEFKVFVIAFYIGQLAEQDPEGYFHIISKDKGFDPLIRHLKGRKIFAQREKALSEIPLLRLSSATSVDERVEAVIQSLAARGSARPRKVRTLANTINSQFMKTLKEREVESIITALSKRKLILIDADEKVTYRPPISQP